MGQSVIIYKTPVGGPPPLLRLGENMNEELEFEFEDRPEDLVDLEHLGLPAPTKYVVEDLLSIGRVHLIGGPSGGGKTTLMFQMYEAMFKGEPFLGRRTRPVKWAYIAADRTVASVHEAMRRVGVVFPVFSLVDHDLIDKDLIDMIMPRLTSSCGHKPDFVYIDGFTAMCPGGSLNNYILVAKWLARLARYCERMGITILGACHTTKTKEGEKFLNPRQRIAGSVAWAGFSETVIIIEPPDDSKSDATRLVSLLPRNHPAEHLTLTFDSKGRLSPPDKIKHQEEVTSFLMDGIMENFTAGEEVSFRQLWGLGEKKGMNKRTFQRWLMRYVGCGKLIKQSKGAYVIPKPSEPATVN